MTRMLSAFRRKRQASQLRQIRRSRLKAGQRTRKAKHAQLRVFDRIIMRGLSVGRRRVRVREWKRVRLCSGLCSVAGGLGSCTGGNRRVRLRGVLQRCGWWCLGLYSQMIRSWRWRFGRSEEHTSELQSRLHLVCRLLLEKKKKNKN